MKHHTPGPWRTSGDPAYTKNQRCDAQLIAAAPDLLRTLKAMVAVFNVKEVAPLAAFAAIEQAKGAIEQAEG
jgi:hypothetical protein